MDCFINKDIEVKNNSVFLRGEKPIYTGKKIECSPIIKITNTDWSDVNKDLLENVFVCPYLRENIDENCGKNSGIPIDNVSIPVLGLGYSSIYKRDSVKYNALYRICNSESKIVIVSCKLINPNEEIILKK